MAGDRSRHSCDFQPLSAVISRLTYWSCNIVWFLCKTAIYLYINLLLLYFGSFHVHWSANQIIFHMFFFIVSFSKLGICHATCAFRSWSSPSTARLTSTCQTFIFLCPSSAQFWMTLPTFASPGAASLHCFPLYVCYMKTHGTISFANMHRLAAY